MGSEGGFKGRIQRYYLGKLTIQVESELALDGDALVAGEAVGAPARMDAFISLDTQSQCGVFTLVSLAAPFLVSHLTDCIIRNQLSAWDGTGWENLYTVLNQRFGLHKRGTPKQYITFPQHRDCLTDGEVDSLLMSEIIYPPKDSFGCLIDAEVTEKARSERGMGQYDRGLFLAHTNVALQFSPGLELSVSARLVEESITLFYIELLVFEEAAVQIAEHQITQCLTDHRQKRHTAFLKQTHGIYRNYAKTIEFWAIQMNFPSSQKSVETIRGAFRLDEQTQRMERDAQQLQRIFDARRDIMDRIEAAALNLLALFLTMTQVATLFAPDLFSEVPGITTQRMLGLTGIVVLMAVFGSVKRLLARTKN